MVLCLIMGANLVPPILGPENDLSFGARFSGVPGWGAQILGRFLAPNPGPLFKARMRPRNSTPADLALSVGPIPCTVHAGESRPPVPSQQPGCLSHRPSARTVTMSLP